ncbi:MAG: bifunctional precorrin-2 dehydrogenase/sirohydrochlorin ferrochelatase [Clostridiales bacterium]|nr:bifunctional precorrin-2 dehydrogenase/sirohydrochlorin ferrochelatase [Clostridiales bacterium]
MLFPLFIDINEKNILVVGGGTIADRRIHTLLPFTEYITVVSPTVTDELSALAESGKIQILLRPFETDDLNDRDIVLAATNDDALNQEVCRLCRECGIPVNASSDQSLCDFQFPSIVTDGEIVVGINASGKNHSRVKETRQNIECILDFQSKYTAT